MLCVVQRPAPEGRPRDRPRGHKVEQPRHPLRLDGAPGRHGGRQAVRDWAREGSCGRRGEQARSKEYADTVE